MLRIQHWNKALELVRDYDGLVPLHHYLKKYFSAHKKHGSKDRKTISHLCYTYFRIGSCLKPLVMEERLKLAVFLTHADLSAFAAVLPEEWLSRREGDLANKIKYLQASIPAFSVVDIFRFRDEVSGQLDFDRFNLSHLQQPDIFLRIRPGREEVVATTVSASGINAVQENASCLRMQPSIAVDQLFSLNKDVVVQDYSSQRLAEFFMPLQNAERPSPLQVWDCCAASGGKSLLAVDVLGNIDLTVSDVRPSILQNLASRFREAGLGRFRSFCADLSGPSEKLPSQKFDLVICDVPCSGSGTWGRTPEQLYFFAPEKIDHYQNLQQQISATAVRLLKPGGWFLYVTCSVFSKENEQVVGYLESALSLTLVKQELLKGYGKKADTLFAALFTA